MSAIQSDKKLKTEKEKSQNYILEELQKNKESLEKSIAYHQAIKIELDSIYPTLNEEDFFKVYFGNDKFRFNTIKGWKGTYVAQIDNTAFEGAKLSGIIKEYNIESLQSISAVYNSQNRYNDFGNSILTRMMSLSANTKVVDVFGTIEIMTTDLLDFEKSLLQKIEKTENDLKTNR